jgi:DNA repair exonuclease SbcCD ATPase subunit
MTVSQQQRRNAYARWTMTSSEMAEAPARVQAKLNISAIELRNFMSFGDYVTRLELSDLGPVLIVGEIPTEADNGEHPEASNGAGKTSLLTAFIWCLFGRTATINKPGDKIVNWYTGQDCYVKIETTDGWEIKRTRNVDGHDELIVCLAGEDKTHSTNTNAQAFLDQLFGLDFDIFTASVFCGQMSKSFLETAPVKRKEALERILGLDKLNILAEVAKEEIVKTEREQAALATKVDVLAADITRITNEIAGHQAELDNFDAERQQQVSSLNDRLTQIKQERDALKVPDIDKLREKWQLVKQVKDRLDQLTAEAADLETQSKELNRDIHHWNEHITRLEAEPIADEVELKKNEAAHAKVEKQEKEKADLTKQINAIKVSRAEAQATVTLLYNRVQEVMATSGTTCPACSQEITEEHASELCAPLDAELEEKRKVVDAADDQIMKLQKKLDGIKIVRPAMTPDDVRRARARASQRTKDISDTRAKISAAASSIADNQKRKVTLIKQVENATQTLEKSKPKVALDAAEAVVAQHKSLDREMQRTSKAIDDLKTKKNPYEQIIKNLNTDLEEKKIEVDNLDGERKTLDILFNHYKYIHRSYGDRRNIKKWLLDDLIPFLNKRIHYYLDSFGIDLQLSFTATLSESMEKWDYELCSGGERKRLDLAIMFGLYDLYLAIYGPQCNIMIIDEADGKLDSKGVRAFTDIVLNDFAGATDKPRPETILVVSHKSEMKAAFPSQIVIKKEDSFSSIAQITT